MTHAARVEALRAQRLARGELWTIRLVRLSMWLAWVGLVVRPVFADVMLLRTGARLLGEVGAVILIGVAGSMLLKARNPGEPPRVRRMAALMTAAVVAPGLYGLALGTQLNSWAQLGFFPFATALLIVLGSRPGLLRALESTLFAQLALGTLFVAYVLVFDAPTSRVEWTGEAGNGLAKFATRTIFAMPFFLALLHRLPTWKQGVTLLSYLAYLAMGITGSNRGMTLLALVFLPAGFIGLTLRRGGIGLRQAITGFALIGALGAVALMSTGKGSAFARYFDARWQETSSRLTGGSDADDLGEGGRATLTRSREEFLGERSRGGEMRDFIGQLEPLDLLLGRGLGGSWKSSYWGVEWRMVHFGPGHLVLQGGLPLLLCFVVVMALALVSGARDSRNSDLAAGAVLYLIAFLEGWVQHGAIQDQIEVYFAWICVGVALAGRHLATAPSAEHSVKVHWLVKRRGSRQPRPRPRR